MSGEKKLSQMSREEIFYFARHEVCGKIPKCPARDEWLINISCTLNLSSQLDEFNFMHNNSKSTELKELCFDGVAFLLNGFCLWVSFWKNI